MLPLNTNHGLLVLDCDNLAQSANALFAGSVSRIRVNYRKIDNLMELRLRQLHSDNSMLTFSRLAFVSVKPQQHTQLDFLCYLNYLGYTVYPIVGILDAQNRLHKHPEYFDHLSSEVMRFFVEESSERPATLHVASGASRLRSLYYKLQRFGVAVELYGFSGSISAHIEDVTRHSLDSGFLLSNG